MRGRRRAAGARRAGPARRARAARRLADGRPARARVSGGPVAGGPRRPARTGWCRGGSSTPGSSTRPSPAARRCCAALRSPGPRWDLPVRARRGRRPGPGGDGGGRRALRGAAALGPAGGGATAIALRGYAPITPRLAHAQVIAFDRAASWPAYAWSFPVGDGSANVGYGEILAADGPAAHPRAPARPAGRPAAGRGGRCRRLEGPPPAAVDGRWHQPDGRVLLAGDALGWSTR